MNHFSRLRAVLALVILAACGGDDPAGPSGPGAPTKLSINSQPAASAQSSVVLPAQPSVRLRDAAGIAVPQAGVVVTASTTAGVTLANNTATTDASGTATFNGLTLTGTIGNYTITFNAPGLTGIAATPVALAAGPATALAMVVQPSAAGQAGVALAQQPAVRLKDGAGNDATQAGITVTATLVSGTATLSNAVAQTNASGAATFAGLTISGDIGLYALRFSATGLASVDAAAATNLAAGPPTQVALFTPPSTSATNGAVFATQAVTLLRDAFGNDATQAGLTVVATITTAPAGGGTLAGDSAVTGVNGRATFSGMKVTGAAGNYSIRFAVTGLASIVAPVAISAASATKLGVTTQPSANPQNGVAMAVQPVVQVQDQSGNAVAQAGVVVHAALSGGGATLSNDSATTDATGKATFSGLRVTGTQGLYALQFSATGLTSVNSANFALQAGAATKLALTTQPATTAQNAIVLTRQPVVRLEDVSGNPVATANVTVTASIVSGTVTLASATAITTGGGVATFSGLSLTAVVGSYTLRFSAPSVTQVDAAAPTVLAAGTATQLSLTTQPSVTGASGAALATQPVVQLRDVSGNAVAQAGVAITAGLASGTGTITNGAATTLASGAATFSGLALSGTVGNYTLRFSSGSLTTVDAAAALALGPGAPVSIVIITAPPATGASGSALSPAPVVEVHDGAGNPVPGVVVEAGASGTVTVSGNTATTLANGQATFNALTLTGIATGYSVRFCIPACSSAIILKGAPTPTSISAGPPAQAAILTAPSPQAQSGVALVDQPEIVVTDASGNPVPGATVSATAPGAATSGGSAVTDAFGRATFVTLGVTGAPAVYALTFTSGSATVNTPLTLDVGDPATLTITTAPSTTSMNGLVFATQPVVNLRDATNNPIPGATVTVTTGGGAIVSNGTATTNAGGSATFTGLGLTGTATTHTLTFAVGAAQATANVTLSAGAATTIALTTQPSVTAQNGVALAAQPVVHVTDGTNGVPGVIVTASIVGGGAAVSQATATTDGSGDAHFAGLMISGTASSYTLRFSAAGAGVLTTDAAASTALSAGAAAMIVILTQPSVAAPSGTALATQPVVQVTDVGGNPILVAGTTITATLTSSGTVSNNTALTNGSGVATFSGLAINALVGSRRLHFASGALQTVNAAAPTVISPGTASQLSLLTQPSRSSVLGQPLLVQPVVQIRDAAGNAVSQAGTGITVTVVAGSPTLVNTSATTDALGKATFSGLGITTPAGAFRFRFTSAGLAAANAADSTVASTTISSGVPIINLSGAANSVQTYAIQVMPGDTLLTVTISGSGGAGEDADLYVRLGDATDISDDIHDCFPNLPGSVESCELHTPTPGLWYISIYGFFSYSQVTLTATRKP